MLAALQFLTIIPLHRKFAGLTGDTYGAIAEITEVGALIIVSLLVHNHWLWVPP